MTKNILVQALAVILGIAMLFQFGCAGRSRSASFYVLNPVADTEFAKENVSGEKRDISSGISHVSLPKYLRKSQIVTRTGNNELHLAEFDRWAGKIEEDIGRVIAENLTYLLSTDKVLSYPTMEAVELDYNVKLDISRFDGTLGGQMDLIVRWGIFDGAGNSVYDVKATHIKEPTTGGGYNDMVAAQSRALAHFSRELADAILQVSGR